MLTKSKYPIMEFDDALTAKLNPDSFQPGKFNTDKMVITFFPEVVKKLVDENLIIMDRVIPGENPVEIYRFTDDPNVLITLGQVGCPACAGNLDLFQEMGVKKVMFCGGGGVLDRNIEEGQILLVEGAIRDDGFSYHYLPPSRVVYTNETTTDKIAKYLEEEGVSYLRGLTWTTDAIFRETADKIELRKAEGGKIVEMEQAGH
ncbi:MAG: nucleoside phosphorylase [Lachnospiraceae bacterium]|nr:nucleoside phosphorylase [Lachnospiraceae bacterium]